MAALTADEDRDYGELELDDELVTSLTRFEDIGFKVSGEEWKQGVEPSPELNFSAGAAVHWAGGAEWSDIVRQTRAEEGEICSACSRELVKRFCRLLACAGAIPRWPRWQRWLQRWFCAN